MKKQIAELLVKMGVEASHLIINTVKEKLDERRSKENDGTGDSEKKRKGGTTKGFSIR